MSDLSDLEAEAAASRARLEDTIGRIQDKLTLSGMVDDFIGRTGTASLAGGRDMLSVLLNRHPLPVMIAAAGIGFLIHRRNRRPPAAGEPVESPVRGAFPADGRAPGKEA